VVGFVEDVQLAVAVFLGVLQTVAEVDDRVFVVAAFAMMDGTR